MSSIVRAFLMITMFLGLFVIAYTIPGDKRKMEKKPNRLVHEKSPYLLQHAYNPVDWYPWGDEAFTKAHKENKPIFLSIGYSTCHWCHVMEHESFEDPEVASLMNENFISIKVDREERPDLDHIYMMVCQMLTGSGGWPLTIMMTPNKKPFYAATYIPKRSRFGRLGMMELIPRIKEVWETRHNDVLESAEKIVTALKGTENGQAGVDLTSTVLDKAYEEFSIGFDKKHGGFGNAPKFPTPHNILFLLRYWKRVGKQQALEAVEKTLQEMRQGGIYDHIGYGFHRYSTDREWLVPHFEKMLYDQGLLAMAYLEAFQATRKEIYGDTAKEIFTYVLRDMTAPEGGFYSAEDADSEGVEGKFYLWQEKEIRKIFDKEEADLIIRVFNVKRDGNFLEEAAGGKTGTNILHLKDTISSIASDLKISVSELNDRIESARSMFFKVREKRVHPHKDDKILTDWNGLMIAAFARGAQILGEKKYREAAENAADFLLNRMMNKDGRLLHRYREGQAGIEANLDDYTFLVWGLIELYEATFDTRYLTTALALNKEMINHFWDKSRGGLFFTPDDGEKLIARKKEINDGAIPSGNSVAMLNMLRLARFTGDSDLEEKAAKIERAFSSEVKQMPLGYTHFMTAVDFGIGPSYEVVIVGNSEAEDTEKMLKALRSRFIPNKVTILRPTNTSSQGIDSLAKFVKYQESIHDKATAYVCLNYACKTPTTDIKEMLGMIS